VGRPLGKPKRKENFRMELMEIGCETHKIIHTGSSVQFFYRRKFMADHSRKSVY
jgi:hypothetical protein